MRTATMLLISCVAVLATAPQVQAARWSRADTVQRLDAGAGKLNLASNERGDRIVTWQEENQIWVARARPGRGFGGPMAVPGSAEGFNTWLDLDPRGNALIVWRYDDNTFEDPTEDRDSSDCCDGLKAVRLSRGGRFGDPVVASPVGEQATPLAVEMASTSRYAIVYQGSGRDTIVRLARGDESDIPARAGDEARPESAVAWFRGRYPRVLFHEQYKSYIREAVPDANGTYDPPEVVGRLAPNIRTSIDGVHMRADPRGGQVVSWQDGFVTGLHDFQTRVGAGYRSSRGGPLRSRTLATGRLASTSAPPTLAVAASGAAAFSWTRGNSRGIFTAGRRPGRGIGGRSRLWGNSRGYTGSCPAVSINSRGTAIHVWPDRRSNGRGIGLKAAFTSTGGRPRGEHLLTSSGAGAESCGQNSNFVAIDERGRATVIWADAVGVRAAYYR